MLGEQIRQLKELADYWKSNGKEPSNALRQAADTIEALSAKLAKANMERSETEEKKIAKKIIFNNESDREYEDYICPNCKDILQQRRKGATAITIFKYKYCHNCGQKLDWSEIK